MERTEDESFINRNYGKDFQKHLLEQYKLFVHTSLDVTSKRLESNKFHLTLNSIIFGIASYLTALNQHIVIILLSSVGIIVSIVWWKNILAYKELNKAKFKVIHELEPFLPACLFKCEEKHYLAKYHGLTSSEKYYPLVFIGLYAAIVVLTVATMLFSAGILKSC